MILDINFWMVTNHPILDVSYHPFLDDLSNHPSLDDCSHPFLDDVVKFKNSSYFG